MSRDNIANLVILSVIAVGIVCGISGHYYGRHQGFAKGYSIGKKDEFKTLREKHEKSINDAIREAYSSGCNYGATTTLKTMGISHDGYDVLVSCNRDSVGASPYYNLSE